MEIISFKEVKERKQSKGKDAKHLSEADDRVSELQRQYQEYAQFCNQWYEDHVIGQDKDGRWIYKKL